MKITRKDSFWIVTDPTPESTLGDICHETNLESFENIVIGHGMDRSRLSDDNLTIYTDETEAHDDAMKRLAARV
jgi:hypothetical protein